MVRANKGCSSFCTACKTDCHCDSCSRCHTCEYNQVAIGRSYYICKTFRHSCKKNSRVEDDNIGKEQQEIDEDQKYDTKIRDFVKNFGTDIIELKIGKDNPESRFASISALRHNSDYFKNCFSFDEKVNGEPTSSKSKPLILNDEVDRVDAFDCFLQFAYWQNYYPDPSDHEIRFLEITLHAHVYALAERLQAIQLKKLALRKASVLAAYFCTTFKTCSASLSCIPRVTETIYLHTPEIDAFRALISALSAACLPNLKNLPEFKECIRMLPDFAVDLVSKSQNGEDVVLDGNGDFMPY